MLEFEILGPLAVSVDGRPVDLGGARQRAVLAVLLLNRNAVVSVDRLLDLVWDEAPPPTAETALQGHVSRLRRLLGADAIETRPPGYLLRAEAGAVDSERFEQLVATARDASPRRASDVLRDALALWRGPVLADLAFESFAAVEIARLDELRLAALEGRIEAELACSRHHELIPELDALVAEHPYRERLHGQRILALYRAGRQADALAAYQAARTVLDEGLGIDPGPELQALEIRVLQQDPSLAPPVPPPATTGNLPAPPTPLVGRLAELAELLTMLRDTARLVTLTGPGGTGKTRLALEVAFALAADFDDGAWFVDLASATDVAAAISAIQVVLGVSDGPGDDPLEPLRRHLRDRSLLLVLDNLEQVLDVAPAVADLLAATPGLRILVTSRAPLQVGAEREYPVPPLPVPGPGDEIDLAVPPAAVALFAARAAASAPAFALTASMAPDIAELCRRLDGLPLAIELAASRVRLLSPAAILERVATGLDVLRAERRDLPERQRTLEAAIDWSYRLLDERARLAFRACATFAGGFTLAAFEAVCAEGDGDALDTLGELVEGSLVTRRGSGDGEPRFAVLETIRQFAERRLAASPEAESTRERHARFHRALATRGAAEVRGPNAATWLPRLEVEHDNMRAALRWLASAGRHDELVEFVAVLSRFWLWGSGAHHAEGRTWIARALEVEAAGSIVARATSLRNGAVMDSQLGDLRGARNLVDRSVALWETTGDRRGLGDALRCRGVLLIDLGEIDGARESLARAEECARSVGDGETLRAALNDRARLAVISNDPATAARLWRELVAAMTSIGDRDGLGVTLHNLAYAHMLTGDLPSAEDAVRRAAEVFVERDTPWRLGGSQALLGQVLAAQGRLDEALSAARQGLGTVWHLKLMHDVPDILEILAGIEVRGARPERAVEQITAAAALRETTGQPLFDYEWETVQGVLVDARAALGDSPFEVARLAGSTTPIERVIEAALAG